MWFLLLQWYGGGPEIKRMVRCVPGISHSILRHPELFPPRVRLYYKKEILYEGVVSFLESPPSFLCRVASSISVKGGRQIMKKLETMGWSLTHRVRGEEHVLALKDDGNVEDVRFETLFSDLKFSSSPEELVLQFEGSSRKNSRDLGTSPPPPPPLLLPEGEGKGGRERESRAPPPPSRLGLKNLGNTCYLNSSLQGLAHACPLSTFLTSRKYLQDLNPSKQPRLASELSSLLLEMRGEGGGVLPSNFKKCLVRYAPQFSGFEQHDAHEVLALILDGLHEDLNRARPGKLKREKKGGRGGEGGEGGGGGGGESPTFVGRGTVARGIRPPLPLGSPLLSGSSQRRSEGDVCRLADEKKTENTKVGSAPELSKIEKVENVNLEPFQEKSLKKVPGVSWMDFFGFFIQKMGKGEGEGSEDSSSSSLLEEEEEEEEERGKRKALRSHFQQNDSVISDLFDGILKTTVKCLKCDFESSKFEVYRYLSLPIPTLSEREFQFWIFPLFQKNKRIEKIKVKVDGGGRGGDLYLKILKSKKFNLKNFLIGEVFQNKIHRIIFSETPLSEIGSSDILMIFPTFPSDRAEASCPSFPSLLPSSSPTELFVSVHHLLPLPPPPLLPFSFSVSQNEKVEIILEKVKLLSGCLIKTSGDVSPPFSVYFAPFDSKSCTFCRFSGICGGKGCEVEGGGRWEGGERRVELVLKWKEGR